MNSKVREDGSTAVITDASTASPNSSSNLYASGLQAHESHADVNRNGFVITLVQDIRLLLIALWLGAAVFTGFVVAPSAFSVLPTRELAGAIVGRTLAIINTSGFIIALLLLLSIPIGKSLTSQRARAIELISLILIALMTGIGQWVITARLQALSLQMSRPIDEIAKDDPLRVAFGALHGYSVIALSIGIIAGTVALLTIARRKTATSDKLVNSE